MFSYFSVNCVFNIIEYFSYLNLWLVILFLFIMLFFFVLGSTQLISSSRLCSDVVFETSLVLFSLFLVIIIISPALIILLDLELIIMPSFIIYSCGVQWLWSFSLSYFNWINNCDHYVYSSYLVCNKLSVLNVLSVLSFIYLTHNTLNLTRLTLNTMYTQHTQNLIKFNTLNNTLHTKFNTLSLKNTFNTLSLVWAYWINQSILNKTQYNKLAVCLIQHAKHYSTCKIIIPLIKFSWLQSINFIMYWACCVDQCLICWLKCVKLCLTCCIKCWAKFNNTQHNSNINQRVEHLIINIKHSTSYLFNTNELIIMPLLSTIRYYVFSYDVIHSLGIYSFGIKIDAIPGRFNFTTTIQTLIKGEHRGMCYESCGLGHSSMLIIGLVLSVVNVVC